MLNYANLRDIQKKEMESSALVHLPEDFYSVISELLAHRNKEAMASQSILAIKEYENIKKVIISIQSKREEKIVLMAVRGEKEAVGLTTEEKDMLRELSSIIRKSRDAVKNVWSSEMPIQTNIQKVKILRDVSQYRGIDNLVYGPFKNGEEKALPKSEAEWLLKAGMAETL